MTTSERDRHEVPVSAGSGKPPPPLLPPSVTGKSPLSAHCLYVTVPFPVSVCLPTRNGCSWDPRTSIGSSTRQFRHVSSLLPLPPTCSKRRNTVLSFLRFLPPRRSDSFLRCLYSRLWKHSRSAKRKKTKRRASNKELFGIQTFGTGRSCLLFYTQTVEACAP